MDESDNSSSGAEQSLGFYPQFAIGLVCGLAVALLAWSTTIWWPNAGLKLWIIVFVVAWFSIYQLQKSQRIAIVLGMLVASVGGYIAMGLLFHFPEFG